MLRRRREGANLSDAERDHDSPDFDSCQDLVDEYLGVDSLRRGIEEVVVVVVVVVQEVEHFGPLVFPLRRS